MGYLPPGADVRRLHHLESRFAPLVRRLIGAYPGQRVPLAPCQEAVARWFGHPHWHAAITRQGRQAARGPVVTSPDDASTPDQGWLTEVPVKTLKSLASALQDALNRYRDHDRGPSSYWTDAKTFALMAQVAGFQSGIEMNQAWAARHPSTRSKASWWTRLRDVLYPTPPEGPWTWAKTREALPGSFTRPPPEDAPLPPEPMARSLGQDLDSGWWMGMTSAQARTHTLLLGALGTGRDTILAGWVTDAIRQGQGVVWFTAHEAERSAEVEQRFNDQARLCLRHQDRVTLDLTGRPERPGSRPVRVNLLDHLSGGGLTEVLVGSIAFDESGGAMWKGRAISLASAVLLALVWERDHDGRTLSLTDLREAFDLQRLHDRAQNPDLPQHLRAALNGYLHNLPGYTSPDTLTDTVKEQHAFQRRMLMESIDTWVPFEHQLFSTDPSRTRWTDLFQDAFARRQPAGSHPLLLVVCGNTCPPTVQRLLLGAVRTTLATRLGSSLDGDYASVVERPRLPRSPSLLVFDNLALSQAPGFALMPAQARASNLALVQAMDDLDALHRACFSPDQWPVFFGNFLTRVLMRQANVTLLRAHWGMFAPEVLLHALPTARGAAPMPRAPVDQPSPEVLLHYAIGEAMVLHRDRAWHVGLVADLLHPNG